MDRGNVVHLHIELLLRLLFFNYLIKFTDKWMELEKCHPEGRNPDREHGMYSLIIGLTYNLLAVKSIITCYNPQTKKD